MRQFPAMVENTLTFLINMIFEVCIIPDIFRLGVVTPCYKRKWKPISDPNSYRKITVTSAVGKVTEKLHLKHYSHPLDIAQHPLQKGFTRGTSNSYVAVIITELIAELKDENSPLVIGFLDAQKAFDVLGHDSVIRKLYHAGIVGKNGILSMNGIRNLYPVLNERKLL